MYKMYVADYKGEGSIGEFLKGLTALPPGYYGKDGGTMLGLTEADRRRIMNLAPEAESLDIAEKAGGAQSSQGDMSQKTDAAKSITSASEAMNKKLTDNEKSALSNVSQKNGLDEQSAIAYYKIYLAKNSSPSLEDFIQLISQNEPNAYGKDGALKQNEDDDNRVIRVTI